MIKKIKIIPGKSYRGRAVLNEYGIWVFTPDGQSGKEGTTKILEVGAKKDFTLYESKNLFKISISVPKNMHYAKAFAYATAVLSNSLLTLKKYLC